MTEALFFDLDDTLVDTTQSFDVVVCNLVREHTGKALTRKALFELRAAGGFNDDWDAVVEICRQRGVTVKRPAIAKAGLKDYLRTAAKVEELMVERSVLERLGTTAPLFIVTGRVRAEYEPVWGERLNPLFTEVVCRDDRPNLKPKPEPDQILDLMERHGIQSGFFVGNSVDDMRAGVAAGLLSIGVTTNQSEIVLSEAGAHRVVSHPREYEGLLRQLRRRRD